MPLPPALLARLQKRGIVKQPEAPPADPEEEIIAESYDDDHFDEKPDISRVNESDDRPRSGAPGCPNKWNPYHICVNFCYEHWEDGTPENRLSDDYMSRRARMLRLYPLPEGWKEVYDPGCARHYYWCPKSDDVSWLSPRHPRAIISESGAALSRILKAKKENWNGIEEISRKRKHSDDLDEDDGSDDDNDSGDSDEEEEPEPVERELTDREKLKRAKRRGIDPMDPAAYGDDVPVGGWSSGMEEHDRKTGADTTAGGALFQSRPYPSPGDIMRRNAR
ncbi:hypothetical protein L596_001767 [Steinernema carpocapsae]|uniref:WW domain-containing protein n=1 Tax=Steinernema carpocapsae TaxID=34508 RepID=A0A4U8UMQ6_STECR|nr:hypothetical protein L596_001767 [Steinernema carpocapsae]